jgi:hypothetical protein
MRISKQSENKPGFFLSRLISMLASLFFSLPTAVILWFGLNTQLAHVSSADLFLTSKVLWLTILVFIIVSLVSPRVFNSMLAMIWRVIIYLFR